MADIKFACPACAQHLSAPGEAARLAILCPNCQQEILVPAESPAATLGPDSKKVCGICLSALDAGEAVTACPACRRQYHADCWTENGGCAVYGCSQVPTAEPRHNLEIPISYWGQEHKPCPACGTEILAAAVRCRKCGATFSSARPQDSAEFHERTGLEQRFPHLRRMVTILFVLCVIPCTAPIGAVVAAVWYTRHHHEVAALPALYPALSKIGLGVGIGQTVALFVMSFLFSALRSS